MASYSDESGPMLTRGITCACNTPAHKKKHEQPNKKDDDQFFERNPNEIALLLHVSNLCSSSWSIELLGDV